MSRPSFGANALHKLTKQTEQLAPLGSRLNAWSLAVNYRQGSGGVPCWRVSMPFPCRSGWELSPPSPMPLPWPVELQHRDSVNERGASDTGTTTCY